jgi:N-acetylmuramoyl-L-alanine amidase
MPFDLVRAQFRRAAYASMLLGALLGACGSRSGSKGGPAPSARAPAEPLPTRPEAVALADAWGLEGSRKTGEAGAELIRRAADLRSRLWRMERREADALEAVELYRQAAERSWRGACEATIDRALLEGEIRADPLLAYREIFLAREKAAAGTCRSRAEAVLSTLAAFKPLPSVLAELEREAKKSLAPTGSAAPPALAPAADPSGSVVVPKIDTSEKKEGRITNVERYGSKDAARIVVFVTRPALFQVGSLEADGAGQSPRLFVDLTNVHYQGQKNFDVGGLVKRVRLGAQKSGTRLVLDLETRAYRRVFYLPEPFRLVIDVSKEPPPVVAPEKGPRKIRRLVIDPGHGGHDPGATGPSGLREKDVTLDIAHRAAPLVARELGISTLLTRDRDDYVALDERTARANAFQADLFISIHCNATEHGSGKGVMTFVLDDSPDAVSARLAARENAASEAAAAELASALRGVLDQGTRSSSSHFAELLQRSAMASLAPSYQDVPDGGVKRAGFYVLAGARMPAVLFETSFISNPVGETRFNTGDFRQKMADAIVNAVRAYKDGH